jgi:hypothetical protein
LTCHIPHHVSEDESDMRGVKDGWYVAGGNGRLVSGPFLSHEDCAQEIRHPTRAPINPPSTEAERAFAGSTQAAEGK